MQRPEGTVLLPAVVHSVLDVVLLRTIFLYIGMKRCLRHGNSPLFLLFTLLFIMADIDEKRNDD